MSNELLLPTLKQYEEFARHVCWAHSWYKHISLLKGAEFVFFFSQQAGQGYSQQQPRMHYTWETTEEYHDRFGYLDYMYRFAEDRYFCRDSYADLFSPSRELLSSCSTILYPYVSNDFNAPSVLHDIITEECLDELRAASDFPRQKEILQWFELYQLQEQKWQELSDLERNMMTDRDERQAIDIEEIDIKAELNDLPIQVINYIRLEIKSSNLYVALQKGELEKIRSALDRLHQLSNTGDRVWW